MSGKYTVPDSIKALKPKDIPCDIKVVGGKFYVYARGARVPDPNRPGKMKNTGGSLIGKITNGEYVPRSAEIKSVTDFTVIPSILDYGPYALALCCSEDILTRLKKHFTVQDAIRIYTIAVIWFVNGFTPARDLGEIYLQSVLSLKWPSVALSENIVSNFFKGLGRNRLNGIRFEQSLIDDGSGEYAIDGHVILCASDMNELADFGNKYQKIGDTQMNLMMVYDVTRNRPVMCSAFDGALPDKIQVRDVLRTYSIHDATLIVDSGFYSEEDIALYHRDNNRFFIPVPGTTLISKMLLKENPITYCGSFEYERRDSTGRIIPTRILWSETTVETVEVVVEEYLLKKAETKTQENMRNAKPGEKPKKVYSQKFTKSDFGADRLLIFQDCQMHDKLTAEYRSKIGTDDGYTDEELSRLEKTFGVILLRTNDQEMTPEQCYLSYKKRWRIETNYNYVRNGVDFNALHASDYYVTQGISFILIVEGLIYSSFLAKIQTCTNKKLKAMSVNECKVNAARLKLTKLQNGRWAVSSILSRQKDIFTAFDVDIEKQLETINKTEAERKASIRN